MTQHDDLITLHQMLDHIREAVAIASEISREQLDEDRIRFLALIRLVEVVGEAANRVSDTVKNRHPEIPWHEIIGTRNRLIHGYDAVDSNILWEIVCSDFPLLQEHIQKLLI